MVVSPQDATGGSVPLRVLHVITALSVGGAETMLAKLLEHGRTNGAIEQHVLSLAVPEEMEQRIVATGARVYSLDIAPRRPNPLKLWRLASVARAVRPDVVMGWMYHGHLAASLLALFRPRTPVIWNVRHSVHNLRHEKRATRLLLRLGIAASRHAHAVVYNSAAAMRQYRELGYSSDRQLVIPNGFDCDAFRPNARARGQLAARLGIARERVIVGMAARAHPMKDPQTLVDAVRQALGEGADLHLILAGQGMDEPAAHLADALAHLPGDRVSVLGHQTDMPALLAGLDILALPSAWGEGFPNIVAEAMACGVPCLVTDVGDSGWIVANTGRSVAPRDTEAMADALLALARLGPTARARLGAAARTRIAGHFSIGAVARQYEDLYRRASSPFSSVTPRPRLEGQAA